MKSLIVGIIIQLCVLVSILYMFKPVGQEDVEPCGLKRKGASRGVLVISQGLGSLGGRARGLVEYRQTMVQLDELYPVLAGIPDHIVFRHSAHLDNILKGVDTVVYVGPDGVLDGFEKADQFLSFTYPRCSLSDENIRLEDECVFNTLHEILDSSAFNGTLGEMLGHKVLFVLYLTSVAQTNLKTPNNSTERFQSEYLLAKEMSDLERHIEEYYSDKRTVFVSVPHWSFVKDKNPKLSVWGWGVTEKFVSNIQLVDVCPLLASLLAIPIPTESVGKLPLSYFNVALEDEAKLLACNAFQLHQRVFSVEITKQNQSILNIFENIKQKRYNLSKVISEQVIKISQSHMHTSQKCFDRNIFSLVVFSLIGWIFVLVTEPMVVYMGYFHLARKPFIVIIASFITIAMCEFLYVKFALSQPFLYIFFMHLSLLPWFVLLTRYKTIWDWSMSHANIKTLFYICSMILLEEILHFFLDGGFLTVFLVAIFVSLPLLSQFRKTPFLYLAAWYTCCGILIGLLNVPKELLRARRKMLNFASTFWLCYGQGSVFYFNLKYDSVISQIIVIYMALATMLGNAFLLLVSNSSYLYYISWSTFTALILPFFGKRNFLQRLVHTSISFGPSLLLLSVGIESLAFVVLMLFALSWVFLERSHMATCEGHWCHVRRGLLLVLSCSIGYLLTGKVDEHSPAALLTPFLPLHVYWNNPIPYFGALFYKYLAVFTIVMIVYISLISNKWRTDMGFVYGLLLIEMMCLRYLVQFLFVTTNFSEVIFKHILINSFAIIFMLSYVWGLIFSIKYVKEEIKDLNETIFTPSSTQ